MRQTAAVSDLHRAQAVAALRRTGSVYAEDEAAEIWRVFADQPAREAAVVARSSGMPLEQVVGSARFLGRTVALAPGVFVPRRRAEAIVEMAVTLRSQARTVVDLGCGAGALALSLSELLPSAAVHATDADETALACALRTAQGRFTVHLGDWWAGLPESLRGDVDLAVSYLPHVPTDRLGLIQRDFREHEPTLAVDGGPDGLDPFRAVLRDLPAWLSPAGVFVTLVAAGQVVGASDAVARAGMTVEAREVGDGDVVLVVSAAEEAERPSPRGRPSR